MAMARDDCLDEGGRLRFHAGLGGTTYVLLRQGGQTFVAREDPDAMRLTFIGKVGRAVKLLLRMAAITGTLTAWAEAPTRQRTAGLQPAA